MDNLQPHQLLSMMQKAVLVLTPLLRVHERHWLQAAVSCVRMQCVEALKARGQVCGESVEVIFSIRFLCPLLPGSYIWQHSSQQGGLQTGSPDSVVSCRYMLRTKTFPSVCF